MALALVPRTYLFVQVLHGVNRPSCWLQMVRRVILSVLRYRYRQMDRMHSLVLLETMTMALALAPRTYLFVQVLHGVNRPSCYHQMVRRVTSLVGRYRYRQMDCMPSLVLCMTMTMALALALHTYLFVPVLHGVNRPSCLHRMVRRSLSSARLYPYHQTALMRS